MMRFAASVPGMRELCREFIAIGRYQLWSPVAPLCVILSVLQNGKGEDEFVHCHFFFVSVFLKIFFWGKTLYFLIAVMLNYFYSMLYVFLCLV